jgi:hypothetical protein
MRRLLFSLLFCVGVLLAQYPPSTNARRLQSYPVCAAVPADTNILGWSAASNCWTPMTVATLGYVLGGGALPTASVIPRVSAAGTLGPSKCTLTYSPLVFTCYDDTAVTGATTLVVRAGAGQAGTDLQQWKNAAGGTVATLDGAGSLTAYTIAGVAKAFVTGFAGIYGVGLSSDSYVRWYAAAAGSATSDVALSRASASTLKVGDGSAGHGGLTAGTVKMQSLATPVITSVTPSANNGVTCTYVLVAYIGDNTTSTEASAAVSTGAAGPTDCNSVTAVWTAEAAASYYRLSRTVGGTTQGLITAMATWANNTTNCPAGVCTYIDTGSAASGAAPTVNATGNILWAVDGRGNIGASGANGPYEIYAANGVSAAYLNGTYINASATGYVYWSGRSYMASSADGSIRLTNSALADFTCLQYGGTTNAYGAVCRDGAGIKIRVASNDADAPISFLEGKWMNQAEGTCDAANRGRVVMVQGGAGVADTFRVCSKDGADAYAFRALY